MEEKFFRIFTANSQDAINAKIDEYERKKGVKEIERSAPSISIAYRQGTPMIEPDCMIAVTSMFIKKSN